MSLQAHHSGVRPQVYREWLAIHEQCMRCSVRKNKHPEKCRCVERLIKTFDVARPNAMCDVSHRVDHGCGWYKTYAVPDRDRFLGPQSLRAASLQALCRANHRRMHTASFDTHTAFKKIRLSIASNDGHLVLRYMLFFSLSRCDSTLLQALWAAWVSTAACSLSVLKASGSLLAKHYLTNQDGGASEKALDNRTCHAIMTKCDASLVPTCCAYTQCCSWPAPCAGYRY